MNHIWLKAVTVSAIVVSTIGASTAAAASWTVSTHTVSSKGRWSSFGSPNLKTTYQKIASFNGDNLPNAYGYSVWLMNSEAKQRSTPTALVRNKTTYASEWRMVAKNIYYYADPRSTSYEPNNSTIKLHFSADRK